MPLLHRFSFLVLTPGFYVEAEEEGGGEGG